MAEVAGERPLHGRGRPATASCPRTRADLHRLARLHALLESATVVEHADDLPRALETVARVVAESLDYRAVVDQSLPPAVGRLRGQHRLRRRPRPADAARRDLRLEHLGAHSPAAVLPRRRVPRLRRRVRLGRAERPSRRRPTSSTTATRTRGRPRTRSSSRSTTPTATCSASSTWPSPSRGAARRTKSSTCSRLVVRHAARAVQRAQEMARLRRAPALARAAAASLVEADRDRGANGRAARRSAPASRRRSASSAWSCSCTSPRRTCSSRPPRPGSSWTIRPASSCHSAVRPRAACFDPRFEREGCYLLAARGGRGRTSEARRRPRPSRNGRGPCGVAPPLARRPARRPPGRAPRRGVRRRPGRPPPADARAPPGAAAVRQPGDERARVLAQYETMRYLADRDPLTKLLNRRAFVRRLDDAAVRARRSRASRSRSSTATSTASRASTTPAATPTATALLCALRRRARRVRPPRRRRLPDGRRRVRAGAQGLQRADARAVVERALVAWTRSGRAICRGLGDASFGIALSLEGASPPVEHLLRRADEAMYEAKRSQTRLEVAA